MAGSQLQALLSQWRQAEDSYYASVMSAPELYTAAIHLVRAIANRIEVEQVDGLPDAYARLDMATVIDIAEATDIPQRDFLDYHLARDAAFYLRHRDMLEAQARADMQARIVRAQAAGQSWVTLYNNEQEGRGVTFFQRLEMYLPNGLGLYSGVELDWEKGRVYVVEPLVLNPETGEPRREIRPPDTRQEFKTREEMLVALAALRQKYQTASPKNFSADNQGA